MVAFDEGFDGLFGQAEAIDQFFMYGINLLHGFADGEAFVEDEPFVDVGAVAFGQQGGASAVLISVVMPSGASRSGLAAFFRGRARLVLSISV